MAESTYTTALAKGQGMVSETLAVLDFWEPGITIPALVSKVLEGGVLSKATALRAKDIVGRVFAHRYLVDEERPAFYLKRLAEKSSNPAKYSQIFLVYTARANTILHDFIREVYWQKYASGATHLMKEDALGFLESAANDGRILRRWSPPLNDRVASYLLKCLEDFGMLGPFQKSQREILPFNIANPTTIYLSHQLHFSGLSDNAILEHPDWALFGLQRWDIVQELEKVSYGGHFIVQYSGDLLRIAWRHKSMEECIDAIAASQL